MNRSLLLALPVLLIVGCAVSGPIVSGSNKSGFDGAVYAGQTTVVNETPISGKTYRVFNQGSTGFVSADGNLEDAKNRAKSFCHERDLRYRLLSETISTPPHVLGNFPRAEIVFECVEKPKQEHQ